MHIFHDPRSHDPDLGPQEKCAKKSCVSFETECMFLLHFEQLQSWICVIGTSQKTARTIRNYDQQRVSPIKWGTSSNWSTPWFRGQQNGKQKDDNRCLYYDLQCILLCHRISCLSKDSWFSTWFPTKLCEICGRIDIDNCWTLYKRNGPKGSSTECKMAASCWCRISFFPATYVQKWSQISAFGNSWKPFFWFVNKITLLCKTKAKLRHSQKIAYTAAFREKMRTSLPLLNLKLLSKDVCRSITYPKPGV